jgi:hypothetical protein
VVVTAASWWTGYGAAAGGTLMASGGTVYTAGAAIHEFGSFGMAFSSGNYGAWAGDSISMAAVVVSNPIVKVVGDAFLSNLVEKNGLGGDSCK